MYLCLFVCFLFVYLSFCFVFVNYFVLVYFFVFICFAMPSELHQSQIFYHVCRKKNKRRTSQKLEIKLFYFLNRNLNNILVLSFVFIYIASLTVLGQRCLKFTYKMKAHSFYVFLSKKNMSRMFTNKLKQFCFLYSLSFKDYICSFYYLQS